MANLFGNDIGLNYKGILSLGTTINQNLSGTFQAITDGDGNASPLQLSTLSVGFNTTIALVAGATNPKLYNMTYTINNSGPQTGIATGIFLNATETALNGMLHNLMDLQVGGISKFKIRNDGRVDCLNIVSTGNVFASYFGVSGGLVGLSATSSGVLLINDATSTTFNRMMLGGTTNLFPSIKRNGTGLDFRLADDSNYCQYTGRVGNFTTTNKNAIGSPAAGLLVYDTTLNKLSVYNGSAWETVTSV